ncbi:hypothetical protein B2K_19485 [Paenibacillus mucilaginosus K02]|uniref:Short-chain dehydrogenase n=1 Tax=Paenibacillus mucilaginosus K02 TaxID=997761 RepID=I0BKH3_9BACL|nr:hypothetical protein B2K_19485 [Paenibacillus mucilaginosus K02]
MRPFMNIRSCALLLCRSVLPPSAADPFIAYGRSKTATTLFAAEFVKRHRNRGIRAVSVMPKAERLWEKSEKWIGATFKILS